ncbi:MAG: C25 family cysteine peptidase [Candidatus Eiseniibacteriota bacterium]
MSRNQRMSRPITTRTLPAGRSPDHRPRGTAVRAALVTLLCLLPAAHAGAATADVAHAGPRLMQAAADPSAATASHRRLVVTIDAARLAERLVAPGPAEPSANADTRSAALEVEPELVTVDLRLERDLRIDALRVGRFDTGLELDARDGRLAAEGAIDGALARALDRPVAVVHTGWLRGQQLVTLAIRPLRPGTAPGRVAIAGRLEIELALAPAPPGSATPPRATPWDWKVERALAATTIDLRRGSLAPPLPPGAPPGFSPTFRPSEDGSPVEYVIVTSESMAGEFERLAAWKTRKGVQAVVRTTEWIAATYPNGVDPAEQLRFFLRDAHDHWGTLWVLLGGDTEVIPPRYVLSRLSEPDELIPTDLYYACLDGNWNDDGDHFFGEPPAFPAPGDSVDFLPELYVGRAPTITVDDAALFVDKTIAYEQAPAVDALYPASVLLLGEQLTPNLDGADLCEETYAYFPPSFRAVRMYEHYQSYPGALPETEATVVDSMNSGFGVVVHVGHGWRTSMSVGNGTLTNASINQLVNGDRLPLVYAINCASGAYDFNCIGERFLKNPDGGSIAYIGSSRLSNVGAAQDIQNEFFRLAFEDTLVAFGEALGLSKLPFVAGANGENFVRWMLFAMNLLGDPETPLWHRQPVTMDVDHAPGYVLGSGSFEVSAAAGGDPLADGRVTLWKPGDALAHAWTDAAGMAVVPFNPALLGEISVTVTRPGYVPYTGSCEALDTSEPFVHLLTVEVDDDAVGQSSGNGNGAADAGEVVELVVTLRNSGGSQASSVDAELSSPESGPDLTINQPAVAYGTIASGGASSGSGHFLVTLGADAPEAFQPVFLLTITAGPRTWQDRFTLPVHGVALEHYAHQIGDPLPGGNGNGIAEPGESIEYAVTLRNNGTGPAAAVAGTLRVLNRATMQPDPEVTVTGSSVSFGDLVPGTPVAGAPFAFSLSPTAVVEELLLELTWSDQYGVRRVDLADLVPPISVSELTAFGSQSTITLEWEPPADTDIKGYDVYRSDQPFSGYERVNPFTADGSARYTDANLPGLTRYYYYVVTRDSSFNASVPSTIISATTNPPLATGWPIETGQPSPAGVIIDDVDGDHGLEIITGSDAVYVWHADGKELRDGDGNPQTSGVFSTDGQDGDFGFHATPAVADLDDDGLLEVIGVAWRDAQVHVWDSAGVPFPGWPQPIGGDFNWASPLVDDLDLDGDLEIVAVSGLQGKVYAWHHDGTELVDGDQNPDTNGVLYDTPTSFLYASPGAGDIAGGPLREIVVTTNHSSGYVYAFDLAGNLLPGWPFLAGGQVTASPALVDLDGDGLDDILFAAEDDSLYVMHGDTTPLPGWPRRVATESDFGHTSSVVVADVDSDGELDIVFAASDGHMRVWDLAGNLLPGWEDVPFAQEALAGGATQCTPTVADLDGDGRMEIVVGAEDGMVYGWNHDGTEAAGFPIALRGEVRGGVTLWDVDRDGLLEMALICMDRKVYVWDLPGPVQGDRLDWPFFRHDSRNTGRSDVPFTSIGVSDPPAASPVTTRARLLPAVPNPFNPTTTLRFEVPGDAGGGTRPVRLAIYDVQGRLVRELLRGSVPAGEMAARWDGRDRNGRLAASGTYFVRYEVAGAVLSGKLVMLR